MLIHGHALRTLVIASILWTLLCTPIDSTAAEAVRGVKIQKVLPHYLDKQGRHSLYPSLLERDAYQAKLRGDVLLRGGLRFDIRLGAIPKGAELTLHLEARGNAHDGLATAVQLVHPLAPKDRYHRWTRLVLSKEDYTKLGQMIAWRATLRQGETILAEQRSFLW